MLTDAISPDRIVIATVLACLAIGVAFGPEMRRTIARLRNRRLADESASSTALGVEPQQF